MNPKTIASLVASMGTMKFFPSEPAVKLALVELMGDLASNEDQVRWLVKRVRTLYAEWPGEREIRACFCSRYKPKDGIEVYSGVYLDGIPSERAQEPVRLALPPGVEVSAAPSIESAVRSLAAAKDLNSLGRSLKVRDIPVVKLTPDRMITQSDVDRAVEELHERTARKAAGDLE